MKSPVALWDVFGSRPSQKLQTAISLKPMDIGLKFFKVSLDKL